MNWDLVAWALLQFKAFFLCQEFHKLQAQHFWLANLFFDQNCLNNIFIVGPFQDHIVAINARIAVGPLHSYIAITLEDFEIRRIKVKSVRIERGGELRLMQQVAIAVFDVDLIKGIPMTLISVTIKWNNVCIRNVRKIYSLQIKITTILYPEQAASF